MVEEVYKRTAPLYRSGRRVDTELFSHPKAMAFEDVIGTTFRRVVSRYDFSGKRVINLCAGVGPEAVQLMLAKGKPDLLLVNDIWAELLAVAAKNLTLYASFWTEIEIVCDDSVELLLALGRNYLKFDWVIANPPQISTTRSELLREDRAISYYSRNRFPEFALIGSGMIFSILDNARAILGKDGRVLLTHYGLANILAIPTIYSKAGYKVVKFGFKRKLAKAGLLAVVESSPKS